MKIVRKHLRRVSLALAFGLGAVALAVFSCDSDKPPAKSLPAPAGDEDNDEGEDDEEGTGEGDDQAVTLTWDEYTGDVAAFKVYVSDSEDGDFVSLGTIAADDEDFDLESPQATFTTKDTKKLRNYIGAEACFKVTALSADDEESSASNIACTDL